MSIDLDALTLGELLELQSEVVAAMSRRFQRHLAVAFSDVVGSTGYFARHGDVAGRALQQRHLDLLKSVLPAAKGRVVDTAGDGAFLCFDSVDPAVAALARLNNEISRQNRQFPAEHKLTTRVGVHYGSVLTDGVTVSGDAVNLCARVASSANPGEIRLTKEAYAELGPGLRARSRALPPALLKGFVEPVAMMTLDWLDRSRLPTFVLIRETNERIKLPDQDRIALGRLDEVQEDGTPANDIVLRHSDEKLTERISRWHIELRRRDDALVCRTLSDGGTVVDGRDVPRGDESVVKPGTIIQLGGVLTLMLIGGTGAAGTSERNKETNIL